MKWLEKLWEAISRELALSADVGLLHRLEAWPLLPCEHTADSGEVVQLARASRVLQGPPHDSRDTRLAAGERPTGFGPTM